MMFQWPVKTSRFAEKADDLEECIVQERCTQNYEHLLGRQLWSHLEVKPQQENAFLGERREKTNNSAYGYLSSSSKKM